MRQIITILCFLILFDNFVLGQSKDYKLLSDTELALVNDLSSTFTDTIFVISPLIFSSVDSSQIDIPKMVNKYGFSKKQFGNTLGDTLLIKSNKYFKVISSDSLLKYERLEFDAEFTVRNGIDVLQVPILYFIEKNYNKKGICYFYKPIFSNKRTYAIVEYWVTCGSLCGWGEMVLMKLINRKWTIIDTLVYNES
jgi:hypothetical protein